MPKKTGKTKQRTDSPLLRAIWWGQVGNFIAFVIALAGVTDGTALTWGAVITLAASIIGT